MNRGVTDEMVEAAYDAFTRSFASKSIGCNNTRDDLRAAITAALAAEPGAAEGTVATLVEREDDAIITVPHWQWGKMAIARRPKAMSNEQWRPFANRIIAALAAAPHQPGESGK